MGAIESLKLIWGVKSMFVVVNSNELHVIVFLLQVWAGAIGCEMLKNCAMMGLTCDFNGNV